jgi:hypothetical protein
MTRKKKPDPSKPVGPLTNITPRMQEVFEAVRNSEFNNFALISCFYDGKPTAAIAAVNKMPDGEFHVTPMLLYLTDELLDKVVDHDNTPVSK